LTETWLRHLLFGSETPGTPPSPTADTWLSAIQKSLRKSSGRISISGRLLSRITDGIQHHAERRATTVKSGVARFRGVCHNEVPALKAALPHYNVEPAPIRDDPAHTNLERMPTAAPADELEEAALLYRAFKFAAPGSVELADLESRAGKK
jgi:hypothetical protein